jgi:glycogen operon protein
MLNAYWEPLTFELPPVGGAKRWRRIVDTSKTAPDDFIEKPRAPVVECASYRVDSRSSALLLET